MTTLFDDFYKAFEDRFRGSFQLIKERQSIYRQTITDAFARTGKPGLDIGSGRGEFLSLCKDWNIPCQGIEPNLKMSEETTEFKVDCTDALSEISPLNLKETFGFIASFHVVEHLETEYLLRLIQACHQALVPGGLLLFETPNAANLKVGSHLFYTDPTHKNPIPAHTLAFMLEYFGFRQIKTKEIHPEIPSNPQDLDSLLNCGNDYYVIGIK